MNFYEKIKQFFGFPSQQGRSDFHNSDLYKPGQNENNERFEPHIGGGNAYRSFNIFTDPLEIHKYFEQQMSDMLKTFGFEEFGDGFSHHFNFPQLDDIPDEDVPSGDLRDQFLKPGYEGSDRNDIKKDKDIDGSLDIKDWGSVFNGESSSFREVVPKTHYFFGQSVTTKTIRNPDGSTETHHTVRDNQGNEETTVTRRLGDKEYSITKRKKNDGKEESIENLVNLDEKDIAKFFPNMKTSPKLENKPSSFYDIFF